MLMAGIRTFISDSGSLTHIGQFFFDDSISDTVYATAPYTSNTKNTRTLNSEDDILQTAGTSSYVSYVAFSSLRISAELTYITIDIVQDHGTWRLGVPWIYQ